MTAAPPLDKYTDEDPDEPWSVVPHPDGALRIATVNVNGIRAAFRKGMARWVTAAQPDILALQEVRAATDDVERLFAGIDDSWYIAHDASSAKGRAGVAIASRLPFENVRTALGDDELDSSGRWLEADFEVGGRELTVVSAYVPTGGVGTPKQVHKYQMLDAMLVRLPQLAEQHPLACVLGDLNVGHDERDIKNWRGNVKNSGFLPEERAYFDKFFGDLGWVDVGREQAGDVPGPYTWWSMRGKAFDNDSGWRIDYHMATTKLAQLVEVYYVDRAPNWRARWTDHTPTTTDYSLLK